MFPKILLPVSFDLCTWCFDWLDDRRRCQGCGCSSPLLCSVHRLPAPATPHPMATPTTRSPQALALSATLTGHTGAVWCVAWSPDGGLLASAGADASVRLWAPPSGVLDGGRGVADGGVGGGKGRREGPGVEAAGGGDGAEGAAASWTCLSTVGGHVFPRTVRSVAWNPDGRYGRPDCGECLGGCWGVVSVTLGSSRLFVAAHCLSVQGTTIFIYTFVFCCRGDH